MDYLAGCISLISWLLIWFSFGLGSWLCLFVLLVLVPVLGCTFFLFLEKKWLQLGFTWIDCGLAEKLLVLLVFQVLTSTKKERLNSSWF